MPRRRGTAHLVLRRHFLGAAAPLIGAMAPSLWNFWRRRNFWRLRRHFGTAVPTSLPDFCSN
ncbi:hypothetical protein TorRG33x02_353550 [Trema orientale]|uniref:Uncharacterized protein n=1 Tax=Trema orientale TaxID=63057 RepID=A0A2P5ACS4_TREOI|nr:hypothetical protein TorRG33x02_353550 [Trema orientale]